MKEITELKNKHASEDIWLLASGPSMNYIDNSFFDNKITVGVNRTGCFFRCNYSVGKDSKGFSVLCKSKYPTIQIISEFQYGSQISSRNYIKDAYFFRHKRNRGSDIFYLKNLLAGLGKNDEIIVSHSTITTALHICAYLGAKNIIICGHDGGTINGETSIHNYYKDINPEQGSIESYVNWVKNMPEQTILVRDKIKEVYKCNIYSLNPFINLSLEGNKFE